MKEQLLAGALPKLVASLLIAGGFVWLLARGGLPLAFCSGDVCGQGGDALLLLDENGEAHGRAIIPLVADPVMIDARLVQVGDVLQMRARLSAIRRI